MAGLEEFQNFRDFKTVDKEDLKLAVNYICAQLNSPGSHYQYYYDLYSYTSKCFMVLQKRSYTKLGEAVCNGKVVNFLKDEEHKNCSCGSVYYNAVLQFFV